MTLPPGTLLRPDFTGALPLRSFGRNEAPVRCSSDDLLLVLGTRAARDDGDDLVLLIRGQLCYVRYYYVLDLFKTIR